MNIGRFEPGCAKFHDKNHQITVVVAGGQDAETGEMIPEVEMYHQNHWKIIGSLKSGRNHYPSIAILNSSLMIFGGKTDQSISTTFERFDPVTQNWTIDEKLHLKEERYYHSTIRFRKEWCENTRIHLIDSPK